MALVGNLKDLKLANIIQINCIERNVAKVTVRGNDARGAIYFTSGAMVHAEFGPLRGEKAVYEMLALNDGEFKVEAGLTSPMQSISQPWNSVVLEGLRILDEKKEANSPVPRQLFTVISDLKHVKNVFVLNYNGQIVEGKLSAELHPLSLTFLWYKLKKMLNLFYTDVFQYLTIRKPDGYYFIFELRPNLVIVETDLKVIVPEFSIIVKKMIKQIKAAKSNHASKVGR